MSITMNSKRYYRTAEACRLAGISRMTFLRWVRLGLLSDVEHRDWKGWRLFTEDDLARLKAKANHIQKIENNKVK
jgi:DNA-binding transcriptional MerR regulator